MTRELKRDEITYSELKSGIKGIGLGCEDWLLIVKKAGKWRFSLWNLMPYEALTGWISLNTPEDLRTSRKAKIIRDNLKSRWGNASEIIEWIVIEIRYNQTEFSSTGTDKTNEKKDGRQSQADKLIQLCLDQNPVLFHDQTKTAHVRMKQNAITVTLPIRSRPFKTWLAHLLWKNEEKAPGNEAISSAVNILEAMALFEGEKHTLYNRVAPAPDGIWIDMADDKWRAIKVTAEGWQIIDDPPILFKRYNHQLPLVEPKPGGDPLKLLNFINLSKEDEKLLLLVTGITLLIPTIPHVVLMPYGIQGSGKSCFLKLIRRLVDPSAIGVLSLPRDERERVQQLDHHWCAFYDNVTRLPYWISDTLCRAATGGGFTKRELYTDDSDIIYNFKRCVGLCGINIAARQGDLLDRGLLFELQPIPKEKRKTEEDLFAEFESCKAEILGGFLDTLAKAINCIHR